MKAKKIDNFINKALDKMFAMVGFEKFDEGFTKQDNWYNIKSWSEKDYEEFKKWFYEEAKKELRWSTTIIEKEFSYFNLMWGWKIEEATK